MTTSILDMKSHEPDVVINDEDVKRLCRAIRHFLNSGHTDSLGAYKADKGNFYAHVNCNGFQILFVDGNHLMISAQPFDSRDYDFIFWHSAKLGKMVLGDIYSEMGTKKIDNDQQRKASVTNILAPALAAFGY